MPQNPLISVVMPVHNAGDYLSPAVKSILQQSYPHIEFIIVDDHSTDGAFEKLAIDDQRVKLVSATKRGVVHAMQQGVQQAKGEFIARMDADDEALPHRLETQLNFLNNSPGVGIVAAQVEIFSDTKIDEGFQLYQNWLNSLCSAEQIKKELFIESPLPNPTVMFRRDVYQQLGGYHDSHWAEDYDCWLRADRLNIKMAKPQGILLRWRDHGKRLTHTDNRYSQDNFRKAKAHYLAQSQLRDKDIIIWGTGPIGMHFCDLLQEQGVNVKGFIEINPRRIGGIKRDLPVWPMDVIDTLKDEVIIGAVGSRGARQKIRDYLVNKDMLEGKQFIFVA